MAESSVISEFLVSLGFQIKDQEKFEASIENAGKLIAGMATAIEAAAAAATAMVVGTTEKLQGLYYAAQKFGASAQSVEAWSAAVGQVGGSAADARGQLEAIQSFLSNSPGGMDLAKAMGLDGDHGAVGLAKSLAHQISQMGTGSSGALALIRARFGPFVQGMSDDMIRILGRAPDAAYNGVLKDWSAHGVDYDKMAADGQKFQQDWREFINTMTPVVDRFLLRLAPVVEGVTKFLAGADKATGGWSTALLALSAVLIPLAALLAPIVAALIVTESTAVLVAAGIMAIVAAVAAVLGYFALAVAQTPPVEKAMAGLGRAFDRVGQALQPLWDWIGRIFGPVGTALWRNFADAVAWVLRGVTRMVDALAASIHGVHDALKGNFSGANHDLAHAFDKQPDPPPEAKSGSAPDAAPGGPDPDSNGSASDRHRNPGNIMGRGGLRTFASLSDGWAAMQRQLVADFARGQTTVRSLIDDPRYGWSNEWAPGNSHTGTANYMARIARALGIGLDDQINYRDPTVMARIMRTMNGVERGGPGRTPMLAPAFTANITVNGAGDPHATGRAVHDATTRAYADMVRQTMPRAS